MTPAKVMIRVDPPRGHPLEQSERHYVGVHVALAREGNVRHADRLGYWTRKVVGQYDRTGGWNHRRTAWRFVTNWVDCEDREPSSLATGVLDAALEKDVVHCVRDLRRSVVEECVLLDRRSGQTSGASYLFEYDRDPAMPAEEAWTRLSEIADRTTDAVRDATGIRLVQRNRVLCESETRAIAEPGQAFTGRLQDETDKVGYLELFFDSGYWGDRFFSDPRVAAVLLDPAFEVAAGYRVVDTIEFDRR